MVLFGVLGFLPCWCLQVTDADHAAGMTSRRVSELGDGPTVSEVWYGVKKINKNKFLNRGDPRLH